jgi:aspartate/methionine/tyrosine aminotransferase
MAIDAKAKALKAAGEDVIGFGAGEPDFPSPAHVVSAAVKAAQNPAYHRYTPAGGILELRAAIAAKTKRDSAYDVATDQVVVSNG